MNSNGTAPIQTDELTPAQKAIRDVKSRLAALPQNTTAVAAAPVQQVQSQLLQRPTAFQPPVATPQVVQQQIAPVQNPVIQTQPAAQIAPPVPVQNQPVQQIMPFQPMQNTLPPVEPVAAFDEEIDRNALKAEGITEAEIAALDAEIAQDLAEDEQFIQQQVPQAVPNEFPPEVAPRQTIGNRINKYFPQYNPDSLDRNALLVLAVAAIGSIIMYLIIRFVL